MTGQASLFDSELTRRAGLTAKELDALRLYDPGRVGYPGGSGRAGDLAGKCSRPREARAAQTDAGRGPVAMPPFRPGEEPIDQEGRLLLAIKRQRHNAKIARQLGRLALESGQPLPSAPRATPAGDATRLRGIPVVGDRVGGAIRGTRPDVEVIARDDQRHRRRRQLARDALGIDETSPGTQPEQSTVARWGAWPKPD